MKTQLVMSKEDIVNRIIGGLKKTNPMLADKGNEAFDIKVKGKMGKLIDFSGMVIEIDIDMPNE